jgi:hypothetical protein
MLYYIAYDAVCTFLENKIYNISTFYYLVYIIIVKISKYIIFPKMLEITPHVIKICFSGISDIINNFEDNYGYKLCGLGHVIALIHRTHSNYFELLPMVLFLYRFQFVVSLPETKKWYGVCTFNPWKEYAEFLKFIKVLQDLCSKYKNVKYVKYNKFLREYKEQYNQEISKIEFETNRTNIIDKYNAKTYAKYKILKLPKCYDCRYDVTRDTEPLTVVGPRINGYVINDNRPFKLHRCNINELESLYRQIQSGISYDENIMKEFIKYSKSIIDNLIIKFYCEKGFEKISINWYYSKLGSKRYEYKKGYEKYENCTKLAMSYKMHNKSDEKIIIDFNEIKAKSRNICAQQPMGKIVFGMCCELGAQVISYYDWSGPGLSLKQKGEKFSNWSKNIFRNNCTVISCDGSAFDSTQHEILIKEIDSYFLNRVLSINPYLSEYFNLCDIRKYCSQRQFLIFSKYQYAYAIKGTQLSGRMNTCLCNTLRSFLYVSFVCFKANINNNSIKFEVNGDDQIIFIFNWLVDKYISYAKKFVYYDKESNICHGVGQICKIFDVYPNITGAEYLSCYLIKADDGDICLMRKPQRFFQSVPYTIRNCCKNKKFFVLQAMLARDIAFAGLINFRNIRLYRIYFAKMYEMSVNNLKTYSKTMRLKRTQYQMIKKVCMENKIKEIYKKNEDIDVKFNQPFEDFLFKKWKIDEDDIVEFNNRIQDIKEITDIVETPIIDKMFNKITDPIKFGSSLLKIYKNVNYEDIGGEPFRLF